MGMDAQNDNPPVTYIPNPPQYILKEIYNNLPDGWRVAKLCHKDGEDEAMVEVVWRRKLDVNSFKTPEGMILNPAWDNPELVVVEQMEDFAANILDTILEPGKARQDTYKIDGDLRMKFDKDNNVVPKYIKA